MNNLYHFSSHPPYGRNGDGVFDKNLKTLLFKDKSIFVTEKELMDLVSGSEDLKVLFKLIFMEWDKPIDTIINRFVDIIDLLRKLEDQNNLYEEFLYRFYNIFVQLHNLNRDFGFIDKKYCVRTCDPNRHSLCKRLQLSYG